MRRVIDVRDAGDVACKRAGARILLENNRLSQCLLHPTRTPWPAPARNSTSERCCYRKEHAPPPEQDGDSSFGDSDKHIFSVGLGAELAGISKILPRPIAFDGYFGLTYLPVRVFRKADPRSAVGDFTVAGFVLQGGVQTRLSF